MLIKFLDVGGKEPRTVAINSRSITLIEPSANFPKEKVWIWTDAAGQPARSIIVDGTVDMIYTYIARQQAQAAVTPPRTHPAPSGGRSQGPRR